MLRFTISGILIIELEIRNRKQLYFFTRKQLKMAVHRLKAELTKR